MARRKADGTVLIEQTSKKIKAFQLISVLMCIVGVIMLVAENAFGIILLVFGFIFFIVARVLAWWRHG